MHVEGHSTFLSNWTNAIDMLMDMIGEASGRQKASNGVSPIAKEGAMPFEVHGGREESLQSVL
ncbi:hypothetical protein E4U32_003655, partial [Claviceps aff. humidiphila group G2b]